MTADALDALAARILAADPAGREEVVEIGAALEGALSGDCPVGEEATAALAEALEGLQAIYEGKTSDPAAAMEAVAAVLAAAAAGQRDPEDEGADLSASATRLRAALGTTAAETADGQSGDGDGTQASASGAVAGDGAADGREGQGESAQADDDPSAGQGQGEMEEDAASVLSDGSQEQGAAAANSRLDPSAESADPAVAAPPRLPPDADAEMLGEFAVESLDHISRAEAALLELESNPDDADQVHVIFRAFHTIKGTSGFLGLDHTQKLAHLAENLLDRARDGEIRILGGYADISLNSCDALRTMIEGLEGLAPGDELPVPDNYDDLLEQLADPEAAGISEEADSEPMRTGDILVGRQKAPREAVERAAAAQGDQPIGKALIEQGGAAPADVAEALRTQNQQRGRTGEATVRVGTDRLDSLIDAVGELVIAQSMVSQDPAVLDGTRPQLARNVAHAGKIVRELQDVSMSLRMVPLKSTFGKMARLVRDLSRKAGKKVRLVSEGEQTEIDRNMVEVLNDPLVHMMRNAVDHGVETPEQRAAAGKDDTGTVRLRAYHSAGNVIIELTDDGKGLDREKIVAKAIERGLIKRGDNLGESEALGLIFRAGFSTAEKVTDVSGRGVGMDVVKTGIESLRGRVDVTSQVGVGTTFTIRLPLTMAITDAMVVRVGQQRYLLPIMAIERSFRPEADDLSTVTGRGEMVRVRGELLPVFRLYDLFTIEEAQAEVDEALLIIVEGEGRRYALLVDELLGQQQVVVKSLGRSLGQVPGVAGGAILGDGRVGLILDPVGLLGLAESGGERAAAA
jgi:two-component system chemotaxis sensor kinase CheA